MSFDNLFDLPLVPSHLLGRVRTNPLCLVTVSSKRGIAFCPRQFRYKTADPLPPTNSMRVGSEVHAQLAELYNSKSLSLRNSVGQNNLLADFVDYWEYLTLVLPPEQPFLVEYTCKDKTYIIGGVIDLVVAGKQKCFWVLDHKVSTGWALSSLPTLASQEQLAVYSWALEKYGIHVEGGIISQVFYIPDSGVYANAMTKAEGVKDTMVGKWGILTQNDVYTRVILHGGGYTLHIERRYYPLSSHARESSLKDLVEMWEGLRDTSGRITGKHCEYCPFHARCAEEYKAGISPPPLQVDRLHHEFFSQCPIT